MLEGWRRGGPRYAALCSLVVTLLTAAPAWSDEPAAGEPGLQVQVDPATGRYSLPAPGTFATGARARSGEETIVVTPGTTAAGGFKVTRGSAPTAPPSSAAVNEQE